MDKITEADIKYAFREALINNVDRLYEDFKAYFSASARRHNVNLPNPPPALPNSGRRARSTKNGLAKLYARYLSKEAITSWTRSEQHYVSAAFSADTPWKKAIQLTLALDAMYRRYEVGQRVAPISIHQHGTLDDSVKALQNLIEELLTHEESSAPETMSQRLDDSAVKYIDALLLYNKDCYLRDARWSIRYAPTYSGQQLFSIVRDGGEIPPSERKSFGQDVSGETAKLTPEAVARGERRLRSLGL